MVGMHVVVSYCDKPMNWIWDRLLLLTENKNLPPAYPIKSITILCQCDQTPSKNELPSLPKSSSSSVFNKHGIDPVRLVELPNAVVVGDSRPRRRNDPAAYAFWIANHLMMERNIATDLYFPQDQIVFVQDSDHIIYPPEHADNSHDDNNKNKENKNKVKFRQLYDRSLQNGFSCGSTPPVSALLADTTKIPAAAASATPLNPRSQQQQEDASLDRYNFALNVASKTNLGNYKPSSNTTSSTIKSFQKWVDEITISTAWNVSLSVTERDRQTAADLMQALEREHAHVAWNSKLRQKQQRKDGRHPLEDIPAFVPVCLGGHFMVTVERVLAAPVHDWNKVVDVLQDDDDAIRFMERLWALLLSPAMPENDQKAVLRQDFTVSQRKFYEGMVSIVRKVEPPIPKKKYRNWKTRREPFLKQWMDQEELLKRYWS
jgi:hypothetical protein